MEACTSTRRFALRVMIVSPRKILDWGYSDALVGSLGGWRHLSTTVNILHADFPMDVFCSPARPSPPFDPDPILCRPHDQKVLLVIKRFVTIITSQSIIHTVKQCECIQTLWNGQQWVQTRIKKMNQTKMDRLP